MNEFSASGIARLAGVDRRRTRRIAEACFPGIKRLADFNTDAIPASRPPSPPRPPGRGLTPASPVVLLGDSPTGSPPARPAAASEPARGCAPGRLWPARAGASTTEALAGLIL